MTRKPRTYTPTLVDDWTATVDVLTTYYSGYGLDSPSVGWSEKDVGKHLLAEFQQAIDSLPDARKARWRGASTELEVTELVNASDLFLSLLMSHNVNSREKRKLDRLRAIITERTRT